jgi:pectate lyase
MFILSGCIALSNKGNKEPIKSSDDLTVFPEAFQDFGNQTPAGSGRNATPPKARIIKVTTLNPYGKGSYYEAITAKGPRTVVFEVSGAIIFPEHTSIQITGDYLTVAGMTAPAKGIAIYGAEHIIRASHVFFEHVRFRAGDVGKAKIVNDKGWSNFSEWDCVKVNGDHVVFKNCTFSWATDELVQTTGNNISFFRCLFMEGLNSPKHHKGPHSKGLLLLDQGENQGDSIAVVQNMFLSCEDRNPQLGAGVRALIINNYVANSKFGIALVHGINKSCTATIENNILEGNYKNPIRYVARPVGTIGYVYLGPHIINGELIENPWTHEGKPIYLNEKAGWGADPKESMATEPPFELRNYQEISLGQLKSTLVNRAGAMPNHRDAAEIRLFKDVLPTGLGSIPTTVIEAGGWPAMPENKVTHKIPEKPFELADSGYTRLENWLNTFRLTAD